MKKEHLFTILLLLWCEVSYAQYANNGEPNKYTVDYFTERHEWAADSETLKSKNGNSFAYSLEQKPGEEPIPSFFFCFYSQSDLTKYKNRKNLAFTFETTEGDSFFWLAPSVYCSQRNGVSTLALMFKCDFSDNKNNYQYFKPLFQGCIKRISVKCDSYQDVLFEGEARMGATLPRMMADIEEKSGRIFSIQFKLQVGYSLSEDQTDKFIDEHVVVGRICHSKHPSSMYLRSKKVLWCMDSWVDEKEYTMYYAREKSNPNENAVTDVYFIPTDYSPIIENNKEITCPPRVLYFTLHKDDNLMGAWVEEIVKKSDGHLYNIQREMIFDEAFGDKVFFLLTGETQYEPSPTLSPKGHVVNSSTPKRTITKRLR